jgi:hypothetical protein
MRRRILYNMAVRIKADSKTNNGCQKDWSLCRGAYQCASAEFE